MPTPTAPLPWDRIDTVLLDMDGTLLDLRFDNWFWQDHLPAVWAAAHSLTVEEAIRRLSPRFAAMRGRLEWYCIDHWSRELDLDVRALKEAAREHVAWLPGAEAFLERLKANGKRCVLVTNAHPETLAIKDATAELIRRLDAVHSTHPFGVPKEDPVFWASFARQEPFDRERTLFVDDSLPVLRAAQNHGIRWLRAVRRPDSSLPARETAEFTGIDAVAELLAL